jgi:putative membrane protein
VALDAFVEDLGRPALRRGLAAALIVFGTVASGWALHRWLRSERALRTGAPLPLPVLAPVLSYGVAVVAVILLVLVLASRP